MAAFEYVYEIFTETQPQSAVTKSNKQKLPNKPAATYVSKVLYTYIKYSCMLCLFMIIGANVFFFNYLHYYKLTELYNE